MFAQRFVVACSIVALWTPAHIVAQVESAPVVQHRNVISGNPFLLLAEWFNGEYERMITPESTVGLRAARLSLGGDSFDDVYSSARAFYRYYPTAAFQRFYVGLDAGITSFKSETVKDQTLFAAGFELGYNWLLGTRQKLYLSLGVGADRLFVSELGDAAVVIPTVRVLNIGLAF
ncbi:MAG TPA: DUF3575 domain-containing protein [Longimicrobiales bacterium]|nr:DUF3575 domain-containing protein [Longimicrobiales bacterium]